MTEAMEIFGKIVKNQIRENRPDIYNIFSKYNATYNPKNITLDLPVDFIADKGENTSQIGQTIHLRELTVISFYNIILECARSLGINSNFLSLVHIQNH